MIAQFQDQLRNLLPLMLQLSLALVQFMLNNQRLLELRLQLTNLLLIFLHQYFGVFQFPLRRFYLGYLITEGSVFCA
jgi:hypothetical protein